MKHHGFFFWFTPPNTVSRCNLRQASEVATRHIHIWSLIDMPQGGSRHLYPQPIPKFRGRFLDFQKVGWLEKSSPKWWCKNDKSMVESVKNHPTKTNKSLSHRVWVASCASFRGFLFGCFHEFGVGMCGFYMGHRTTSP